jgi:GT2 family glycosyltransferase
MNALPLVYIVVLTYNHCDYTRGALTSLLALSYSNYRVLILDNGSTDETPVQIPSEFPEFSFYCNPGNLGFAAGINVGLRMALEAGAEFLLVLNNDVQVDPHLLEPLVLAAGPDVGALAPMINSMEQHDRIWSAGFDRHPSLLEMRGGARGQLDTGQWSGPIEVDYLLGCALLLPAKVLREVGLFDERYFFYYEDLDLSLRIQARGYRLLVIPDAHVWHQGALSSEAGSAFHVYQMARGSVIFFRSHAGGLSRILVLLYRAGSSIRKSLGFAARRRWDLIAQHWRGLRDGWCVS